MDCSPSGSLSMGFPRQEYWRGLPFPSPGDLPDPALEDQQASNTPILLDKEKTSRKQWPLFEKMPAPPPLAFYLGFYSISLLKQKRILKARKPQVG